MKTLLKYHLTEILTGISGSLAALAAGGVMDPTTAAKITVVVAVMGVWRGILESVAKENRE